MLLVRIVAVLLRVVLVVDLGHYSVLRPERERECLGRTGPCGGAVAARKDVAYGIGRSADCPVRAKRRERIGRESKVVERVALVPCPKRKVVERDECRGIGRRGIRSAVRRRHRASDDALRQIHRDFVPHAQHDLEGLRSHVRAILRRRSLDRVAVLDIARKHGIHRYAGRGAAAAEGQPGDAPRGGNAVRRNVALEADPCVRRARAKIPAAQIHACRGFLVNKHERTRPAGCHRRIGRAASRRKHDLRQKPVHHGHGPVDVVVLDQRRIRDGNGHAAGLEVRPPPNLYLRIRFVHAVDRRSKILIRIVVRHTCLGLFDHLVLGGHIRRECRLAGGIVVETRIPVAPARLRLVDVAREVFVHALGHQTRLRSRLRADARRDLDANRPFECPRRKHRTLAVFRKFKRQVRRAPLAVRVCQLDEDLAAVAAFQRQCSGGGIVRPHVHWHLESGRARRVVRRHGHRASRLRARRRHHDPQRILRPADEIPVVLEVPLGLHRVFRLPEDVRLLWHRHPRLARRHVGGRDREHLAVVGIYRFFAFSRIVLLEIRRIGVVGIALKSRGRHHEKLLRAEAAACGLEIVAYLGVERIDVGRADLHDDVGHHVVLRLGVVVGKHELPLRTFHRARLFVHPVSNRQDLSLRRIVVDAVDDVGHASRDLLVFAFQQILVAEELHELAGEVDERRAVRLVDARREEPVGTRRRVAADVVGARVALARSRNPRELRRAAGGEEHPLVKVRRTHVEHDPTIGYRRCIRRSGRRPIDLVGVVDHIHAEVAELRVRRLLRKRTTYRPRGKIPRYRAVLGRNSRHLVRRIRRRLDHRNRIRHRRLRVAGSGVAAVDVNGQIHLAKRQLRISRAVRFSGRNGKRRRYRDCGG